MSITRDRVRDLARKRIGDGSMRHRINLLGVGGVGSNVVDQLSKGDGHTKVMMRISDPDTVELHNLNRSPLFRIDDVGKTKVEAAWINSDSRLLAADQSGLIRSWSATTVSATTDLKIGVTVDARDTLDPAMMPAKVWVKLAYDGGTSISFTWWPAIVVGLIFDLRPGGGSAYEVTPSFYVPAAMLALLSLNFMRYMNFLEITEQRAGTFQMDIDSVVDAVSYQWEPPGENVEVPDSTAEEEQAA